MNRHQNQRSASDADQAEYSAVRNQSTVVDVGIYDDRVAGSMDDFEAHDPSVKAGWHNEDLKYDDAVGRVHQEIERRAEMLGDAYPFRLEKGTLTYQQSTTRLYELFLAICNSKSLTEGEYVELPRVFERIAARLVASFFGGHTEHVHTGSPRDESVGKSFKTAMSHVAERTGEWNWGPDNGLPDSPVGGDGGCDFIVWHAPPDHRKIGQLFILGQCACGNNWSSKFDDLNMKKLQKWFNPLSVVDPVRTFATPFHVTDGILIETSRETGYLFDRARLVAIGHRSEATSISEEFGTEIEQLIKLVIN